MTGNNRNTQAGRKGHAKRQKKKTQNNRSKGQRHNVNNIMSTATALSIMSSNSNHRAMNNKVVTLTGSDFLGRVSVASSASTVSNAIRKVFPVSPSAYPGTRLTQLSELWERYRFNRFSIRYVPSVPSTLACQVLVYQDTDPTDDPHLLNSVDALVRQGVSQAGSQQWNFNSPKVVNLAKRADRELYYTGVTKQNERFNYQGTAYLIQVTDAIDFNGTPIAGDELDCGSLYIDWECEFQTPQINPPAAVSTTSHAPGRIQVAPGARAEFNVPDGVNAILFPILIESQLANGSSAIRVIPKGGQIDWNHAYFDVFYSEGSDSVGIVSDVANPIIPPGDYEIDHTTEFTRDATLGIHYIPIA